MIADSENATGTATVSVTVQGVNKPPTLGPDMYQTLEDTVIVQPAITGILNNDLDPDGDSLTISSFDAVSAFGAIVNVNSDGSFRYDPTGAAQLQALGLNDTADDTFDVIVSDGQGANVVSTVHVTVEGLNERPVAMADSASTPRNTSVSVNLLSNDSDLDGQLVASTLMLVSLPQNGTAVHNGSGTVLYTPNQGFRGTDTFRYTVQDDDGGVSNTALVTILVNDPPQAVDDTATAYVNLTASITVLLNDSDADGAINPATVQVVGLPAHGTATPNPDGTISYTPALNYTGPDAFQYTVRDDSGTVSNVATVTLDVSANPFPWNNTRLRYDVNNDGLVTPVDPLFIINRINASGAGPLPIPPTPGSPPPYYDVVADNVIAPSDANAVINYLNANGGEGEFAPSFVSTGNQAAPSATSQADVQGEALELIVEGRMPAIDPAMFAPRRPSLGTSATSSQAQSPAVQASDSSARSAAANPLLEMLAEEISGQRRSAHANDVALEELLSEVAGEL